ncbi:hypothetical protein BU17DRAFT_41231 [Hysterangium stoloniferum]|nr:hypothetical protein BU17DRAFT_41231 [Hysterangium stoloniferum]
MSQQEQADYSDSVDLSYTIPSNSSVIFFLSRGSYHSGEVTYELSDKPSSGDEIEIDVKISYYRDSILTRSKVCVLDRDDGRGIGFFTPKWTYGTPSWLLRLKFTTIVRFPRVESSSQPLVINSLESDLNNWSQHMASLESQTLFNNVSLQSSNAAITIDAISAISGSFKTSNGPITGSFNVSKSLELHSSNAPVNVQVSLENDPTAEATILDIKTSNGAIKVPVTLISTDAKADDPASFLVSTTTSNAPLAVTFPEAPSTRLSPFYVLNLTGKTSNAPVSVTLHPTYEGSLSLSSSLFSPKVTTGSSSDPSGENRSRTVAITKIVGKALEANVWWGNAYTAQKGKVELKTSNAFNVVTLL